MYRLSRKFFTTVYDEPPMSNLEIKIKSIAAFTLGIIPFGFTQLWLALFRLMASHNVASIGILSAFLTMVSAKIFSLSQWLIWNKYIPRPSGDTINSRLAQYGSTNQPWIDLKTIYKAFYSPYDLQPDEWKIEQWSTVTI